MSAVLSSTRNGYRQLRTIRALQAGVKAKREGDDEIAAFMEATAALSRLPPSVIAANRSDLRLTIAVADRLVFRAEYT